MIKIYDDFKKYKKKYNQGKRIIYFDILIIKPN